jgi:hypothetical protein
VSGFGDWLADWLRDAAKCLRRRLSMRIAVAGAMGNIGGRTVSAPDKNGHQAIRVNRALGVELTGRDETLAYFATTTRNLLAAEEPQSRYVDGAGPERKTSSTWPGAPAKCAAAP